MSSSGDESLMGEMQFTPDATAKPSPTPPMLLPLAVAAVMAARATSPTSLSPSPVVGHTGSLLHTG